MKQSVLRKYARLIARVGVNVQKGQDVNIYCDLDQPKFVELLVDLRSHFPEAKILSTFEIDGKTIRPSDAMNQLRLQLSDLP